MMIQVLSPAEERALECEKPFSRNRKPNNVAMNQNNRCSTPIQVIELVDSEKSHTHAAKPISSIVNNNSNPHIRPKISSKRACQPLRQEKIYRLGRQIRA